MRHVAIAAALALAGLPCLACGSMFREWQPNPENAKVPETPVQLAQRYLFPSVAEMEHWLLMTDDEVLAGKDEDEMALLMDGRFVCDPKKITQPQLGRVTRGGDLNIWGTNLGGFMVLEPWITPSLFYQFLGILDKDKIGMDMKSFCSALGEEEANKQLRRHWATWVTEEDIKALADAAVNTLRIPVGDWQFAPYDPYVNCTAGANEELTRVLDLCLAYGIDVVMDMHALRGSMNGLDNSGESLQIQWINTTHFRHWPVLDAQWIGHYDSNQTRYTSFDFENFKHSLEAFQGLVQTFGTHPAVVAFQPVNEPWSHTPPNAYQLFVWSAYNMVQLADSNLGLIVHDSFRGSSLIFRNWMVGCKNVVTDTHLYTAWDGWWSGALDEDHFVTSACAQAPFLRDGQQRIPHMVGEWSLATDNCAMWLNGLNDNPIGYPQVACDWVECPAPYMGSDQPGAPPNASMGAQLPMGTGFSSPVYGKCPVDKSWENDDATMTRVARAKLAAFSLTSGSFFWNFKTELEPKWSFLEATRRGWLPNMNLAKDGPQYLIDYLDGVCDEIWYKMGFKQRPPVPLPVWAKVLRWVGLGLVALAGLSLFMYTGIEVYRRFGYDAVSDEEEPPKRQKRIQSMPLFSSSAFPREESPVRSAHTKKHGKVKPFR